MRGVALAVAAGLAAGAGGAGVAAAQVSQAVPQAPRLILELDGRLVRDGFDATSGDTVALKVTARDSTGAVMAVTGLDVTIFDPRVMAVVGRRVEEAGIVLRLVAREVGATTLQVRASGLREWLRVDVLTRQGAVVAAAIEAAGDTLPVVLPLRRAPGPWFAGGRLNVTSYSYTFGNQSVIAGRWGVFAEGYGGRAFPSGLRVMGGASVGTLEADSAGVSLIVGLVQVFARGEYVLLRDGPVHPVASLGVGLYRARTSGAPGAGIWNASMFWMLAGGVDYPMSARIVGEARVGTQQLYDLGATQGSHVASLWLGGVGLRYRF